MRNGGRFACLAERSARSADRLGSRSGSRPSASISGSLTVSRARSLRARPRTLPRLHGACRAVPSARLEHTSGIATYRATRSGDEEGPAHGPVAVGARRWVGRLGVVVVAGRARQNGSGELFSADLDGDGPAGRGRGVDRRGGGDGEEGQRVYELAAEIERAMMAYEVTMR